VWAAAAYELDHGFAAKWIKEIKSDPGPTADLSRS